MDAFNAKRLKWKLVMYSILYVLRHHDKLMLLSKQCRKRFKGWFKKVIDEHFIAEHEQEGSTKNIADLRQRAWTQRHYHVKSNSEINACSSKIRESVNQFKMHRTKLCNEEQLEHRSMGALLNWQLHMKAWQKSNNKFGEKNDYKKGLTE